MACFQHQRKAKCHIQNTFSPAGIKQSPRRKKYKYCPMRTGYSLEWVWYKGVSIQVTLTKVLCHQFCCQCSHLWRDIMQRARPSVSMGQGKCSSYTRSTCSWHTRKKHGQSGFSQPLIQRLIDVGLAHSQVGHRYVVLRTFSLYKWGRESVCLTCSWHTRRKPGRSGLPQPLIRRLIGASFTYPQEGRKYVVLRTFS